MSLVPYGRALIQAFRIYANDAVVFCYRVAPTVAITCRQIEKAIRAHPHRADAAEFVFKVLLQIRHAVFPERDLVERTTQQATEIHFVANDDGACWSPHCFRA